MIPWVELDSAPIPGGGVLRLMRRGTEYSIMSGPIELMNSRVSGSEVALATLTASRLNMASPQVLIGGLGMGFTLRAALGVLPGAPRIEVAELVPAVIDWARGPLSEIFAGCLQDPRVQLVQADVADRFAAGGWNAILLDVDNGPGGLNREANDGLYSASGLAAAHRALRPGGVLAVWSAAPDEGFTRRLRTAGFTVETEGVRAGPRGRGARHVIWLATRR